MIHTHDLAVIPFGVAGVALKPVVAQAGFLPPETPLFEIRDVNTSEKRGMFVRNSQLGDALAKTLGANPDVLTARSRGYGCGAFGARGHRSDHLHRHRRAGAKCRIGAQFEDDAPERIGTGIQFNGKFRFADGLWQNFRSDCRKNTNHTTAGTDPFRASINRDVCSRYDVSPVLLCSYEVRREFFRR